MRRARGPFRPEQLKSGDPYELSRGHPVYVPPADALRGHMRVVGSLTLGTDPAVRETGVDVGFKTSEDTLRAPDIAVGNVPLDRDGWGDGAPKLAVLYADDTTDEDDLQTKLAELLGAGARFAWVVRATGPRRVEVHEAGKALRVVSAGGILEAPSILSRPVSVDALFDLDIAREVALQNLLIRERSKAGI